MTNKQTIEVEEAEYAALVEQNLLLRGCDIAYQQVWEKARGLQFSLDEAYERIEQLERKTTLSKVTLIDHRETIKRPSIEPGLPPVAYCSGRTDVGNRPNELRRAYWDGHKFLGYEPPQAKIGGTDDN